MPNRDTAVIQPCGHQGYHWSCIENWYDTSHDRSTWRTLTCPLCQGHVTELHHLEQYGLWQNDQVRIMDIHQRWPTNAPTRRSVHAVAPPARPTGGGRAGAASPARPAVTTAASLTPSLADISMRDGTPIPFDASTIEKPEWILDQD
jgi:hypothetical protein